MDSLLSNTETAEVEESNLNGEYLGDSTDELRTNESYQETNVINNVLSPSKELQEAKRKLEELRLLRFEEKSLMKQEIEQLSEKYGEGEKNSSNMERQLKKCNADKIALDEKVSNLEKEQSIGAQINMMQEQEIIRLEMKLKDEELQRYDVSKQLDVVRKAILEKDQLRLKELTDLFGMKERISQLDESNTYYKTTVDEDEKTIWDMEQINHNLKENVSWLTTQLDEAKSKIEKLCMDVKDAETKVTQSEEKESNAQNYLLECQVNLESQVTKCETLQEEHRKEVEILQQELESAIFNENKHRDKCEQTEHLFHETRREKDEQILELQRIVDRIPMLEEQIRGLDRQNSETDFLLNELRGVVARHIRKQDEVEESDDAVKETGKVEDCVTLEEIDEYFKNADIDVRALHEQITTLSQQVEQEQSMMTELSTSIESLRSELEKVQSNLTTIHEQYEQANETIKLQEGNNESKAKENERLRELIQDCEGQIDRLKTDLLSANVEMQKNNEAKEKEKETSIARQNKETQLLRETIQDYDGQVDRLKNDVSALSSETLQNTASHKEEESRLQLIIQGLESDIQDVQDEKKDKEVKFEEEAISFKEIIENRNKEVSDLQSEMKTLVEDNENLGQRLTHLESYSGKLSEMLEKNQTADDKAREKFMNEIKEYKQIVTDKDEEVIELTRKVEDLNESVREKSDYQEQIDKKLKELAASQKNLVEENEQTRKEKVELEAKLESISGAHVSADNTEEENQTLEKRCSEQLKLVEELHGRINLLETENNSLKNSVSTMESDIQLKGSLIGELSHKTGETTESISSLKGSVQKAESDKRHYQNKLNISRHEKQMMDKTIREHEDEKSCLRNQVANLQRLLEKVEDAKEASLGNMAHYQSQLEALRSIKEQAKLEDLEGQVQSLRVELNVERLCRERLETRYSKRDDQVSQLRSAFDQSLSTISKDTKNIENILGKSMEKIDNMGNNDSDFVDSDGESLAVSAKVSIDNKYLSLPSRRNKSLESSLSGLKVGSHTSSSTPRRSPKHGDMKSAPSSAPKRITARSSPAKERAYIHEIPVRDEVANYRKSKRLSR